MRRKMGYDKRGLSAGGQSGEGAGRSASNFEDEADDEARVVR